MDSRTMRMDSEFDKILVDLKPHLLKLPHKTERQRCALWIKRLCEPVGSAVARKNRNVYAKLLLQMLKRGTVDGPFSTRPEPGPLKTLPAYMSVFLEEAASEDTSLVIPPFSYDKHKGDDTTTNTPDWAKDELKSLSDPFLGDNEHRSPRESLKSSHFQGKYNYVSDTALLPKHTSTAGKVLEYRSEGHVGAYTFRDEQSLISSHEKEIEMKTKVLEAKFHEEKLNLQHKHDLAVQKILDRKNIEIEELKRLCKAREKEHEEYKKKSDKKMQLAIKEVHAIRESKEQQVEDLNQLLEEKNESLKAEYDAKMNDLMGDLEREKYELQKSHTKNIQELLDDTNQRLTNMEEDYNSQTQATKVVVSELERHVCQLTQETESMAKARQVLISEKQQLDMEHCRVLNELQLIRNRHEEAQHDVAKVRQDRDEKIRALTSKNEANFEYLKHEQAVNTTRAQETIRDLEDQIQSLKHSLQDSEQQRTREIREKDSLHQQDVMSIQHLHEKQMHSMRTEWEQERSQHNRTTKSLEDIIKDKEDQIVRLSQAQKECNLKADQAIESYKKQVSDAQQKVYSDMRSQLEKMENDLEQSRLHRDKLQDEYRRQIEEMKQNHNETLDELRVMYEHDQATLVEKNTADRDRLIREYENQLSSAEARLRNALEQQEKLAEERRIQHQEVIANMEKQIRELREEVTSANTLRRQQLVELGLLREEERQKSARDHDMTVARLESELDRQQMELHQQHAAELEQQAHKTKSRLDELEREYGERIERAHERLIEAQNKEAVMRETMIHVKSDAEERIMKNAVDVDEAQRRSKMEHNTAVLSLQASLEREREELHILQRRSQQIEYELKQNLSRTKLDYEEKMKGVLPKALKINLEETITSLRSQVKSLQQRIDVLEGQEKLDDSRSFLSTIN